MQGTPPRVHVQHVGPDSGGGIATVLVSLVSALRALPEVEVETVASTACGNTIQKLSAARRALGRVRSQESRLGRVVHLHTASGLSFWRKSCLLRAARAGGAHTVLHVHGGAFEAFVRGTNSIAQRWIDDTFAAADRVLAVNKAQAEFLARRFEREVELFPNAVPLPAFVPPPETPPLRWLHIGRLGERKGTWDFLRALEPLVADAPAWEAVLVGDGEVPEARRRAARMEGRVSVLGWQNAQEIEALLRSAHVLVLPSYVEGLPMSVLEAMAHGRAVITTPVGGLPELITDRVHGLLVPPGDVPALTAAMRVLLKDEALRSELASNARARIGADYNIERTAERLRDLYIELVHSTPTGTNR